MGIYESRFAPPVPRPVFLRRVASHVGVATAVVLVSVAAGMVGYHHFEQLGWLDAFLNAAMLLGGEGPIETPSSRGGKVFAGMYALYSGLVFVVAVGVILTPFLHRMAHQLHWEGGDEKP
jgi:hypothetical protein